MKVNLYDKNGKKTEKKFELSSSVFDSKVNQKLLSQAVYVYLANQRQANAQTKDRGQVSGGGKKPWRQKGTGRARVGSNRSPIWRGGGITFGPTNERNYKKTMPRKMRAAAIRSAFSYQAKEEKVLVMAKPEFKPEGLTKQVLKIAENLGAKGKVLFVQNEVDQNFVKAVKNVAEIKVKPVSELNTYALLNSKWIVLTDESAEKINEMWGGTVAKSKATKKETVKEVVKKASVRKVAKKPVKKATKVGKTVKTVKTKKKSKK